MKPSVAVFGGEIKLYTQTKSSSEEQKTNLLLQVVIHGLVANLFVYELQLLTVSFRPIHVDDYL